ncbi:hypothetical protein ACFLXE_08550 [Chloroflexota bacterium]
MAIRKEVRGRLECDAAQWQKWEMLREGTPEKSLSVDNALREFHGKSVKIVIEEVTVC